MNHTLENLGSLSVSDKLKPIPRVRYIVYGLGCRKETAVIRVTASLLSLFEHSHSRVRDNVSG